MTDQQKMERLLRMLLLLAGKRRYSNAEIQERFDISERTVFRYLDTIELAGMVIERANGTYRLQQDYTNTRSLQRLMHFTEEEVCVLEETIEQLEGDSAIRKQLLRKLNLLYDSKALEEKRKTNGFKKIQQLSEAIRNKRQVQLVGYRSSNSENITDRTVEPFDFLPEYEGVWCYEPGSGQCKQFLITRMKQVNILSQSWQNENKHQMPFTDAFRMSANKPKAKVEVLLDMKAYNLLTEEYPLAQKFIREDGSGYRLCIPVAQYHGIGRFVLGLPGNINVLGPRSFQEFLKKRINDFSLTEVDSGEY